MNTQNSQTVTFTALAGIDADKCPAAYRMCKIVYKAKVGTDGVKGVKKDSLGAFVSTLSAPFQTEDTKLSKWLISKIEDVQDSIIRSRLESGNTITIPTIDEVIAVIHTEVDTAGTRAKGLSAAAIAEWFTASGMAAVLADTFAAKLGCLSTDNRVIKVVTAYGDNMKLIAGKGSLAEATGNNLVKAMELLADAKPEAVEDILFTTVLNAIDAKLASTADMMAL